MFSMVSNDINNKSCIVKFKTKGGLPNLIMHNGIQNLGAFFHSLQSN